jgi:hypothetical protein
MSRILRTRGSFCDGFLYNPFCDEVLYNPFCDGFLYNPFCDEVLFFIFIYSRTFARLTWGDGARSAPYERPFLIAVYKFIFRRGMVLHICIGSE